MEHCPRPCHYCGGKAGTKDHVVPRVLLDRTQRFMGQITNNSVPACGPCNQAKGGATGHRLLRVLRVAVGEVRPRQLGREGADHHGRRGSRGAR